MDPCHFFALPPFLAWLQIAILTAMAVRLAEIVADEQAARFTNFFAEPPQQICDMLAVSRRDLAWHGVRLNGRRWAGFGCRLAFYRLEVGPSVRTSKISWKPRRPA